MPVWLRLRISINYANDGIRPGSDVGEAARSKDIGTRRAFLERGDPVDDPPSVTVYVSNQRAARVTLAYLSGFVFGTNHVLSCTTLQRTKDNALNLHSSLQRCWFKFIPYASESVLKSCARGNTKPFTTPF